MSAITIAGLNVLSCTFTIPWRGVWLADLVIDLSSGSDSSDSTVPVPSGAQVLQFDETTAYPCTVDDRASSSFGGKASLRVIAGAAGWERTVARKFYSQTNLTSEIIIADTALTVGEPAPSDPTPAQFGQAWTRVAGPASTVFGDRDWYVNLSSGAAQVAAWPTASLDDSAQILDWDPIQQLATISSEVVILPGTVLSDTRFNGETYIVRDVEQRLDKTGTIATVWCGAQPKSRLRDAFQQAIQQFGNLRYLKTYQYRFVLGDPGSMALQAVTADAPDLNPIAQWTGLAGTVAKLASGTTLVIGFIAGSPSDPYVVAVGPDSQSGTGAPSEVDIGTSDTSVNLAGGADNLVYEGWRAAFIGSSVPPVNPPVPFPIGPGFIGAMLGCMTSGVPQPSGPPIPSTAFDIALASYLLLVLAQLPAAHTTKTKAT